MPSSTSCPIHGGREGLPNCYGSTPGGRGTLYATTPPPPAEVRGPGQGRQATGTRTIYDRKFLLECKNSPTARRPPCCLPQTPGVTVPPTAPPPKLEELTEQKETEEEIPDDAQFEMDI
ncbi:eukaryotic translation initiation factor 4E-binding protein 3 isoform X1 [Budorcas taxicolor]|uniref:eukaryotic translation initiation factor 4E-binding protein 3 isoform X1 n=1 Tax=Budorcas taxicolor TaxID=37181 RepID=UPI002283F111|nr:eukaryotic translation initiation factor 4E-binding protein 3 isoform X1 [Budorcas taxicolor]